MKRIKYFKDMEKKIGDNIVYTNTDLVKVGDLVCAIDTYDNTVPEMVGIVLALEYGGVKVKPLDNSVSYKRFGKEEVFKIKQ